MPVILRLLRRLVGLFLPQSLISVFLRAVTQFFVDRGLGVLFGLGLGYLVYYNVTNIVDYALADIRQFISVYGAASSAVTGEGTGGYNYALVMFDYMTYCGFFSALDIIASCWTTAFSIQGIKLVGNKLGPLAGKF